MIQTRPSRFSQFHFGASAKGLERAIYELSREQGMKRRLVEPAFVNGAMREIGYTFEDISHGPHRRTNGESFKYHPQFEEVDDSTVPFPVSA